MLNPMIQPFSRPANRPKQVLTEIDDIRVALRDLSTCAAHQLLNPLPWLGIFGIAFHEDFWTGAGLSPSEFEVHVEFPAAEFFPDRVFLVIEVAEANDIFDVPKLDLLPSRSLFAPTG